MIRAALLLALAAAPAAAQAPPAVAVRVDPSIRQRAEALLPIFAGGGDYDAAFAPAFRAEIGIERFRAIATRLAAELGKPVAIDTLAVPAPWRAELTIAFELGVAHARMVLDPAEPHQITGLLLTGTERRGDSLPSVEAAVRALPGTAQIGVYALGTGEPKPVMEVQGDAPAPLGSAFKLWVLAEAARQVSAGTRRWSDVVRAGPPSLPSGVLQDWPKAAPVTVQTLATLMISISDNSATDTLMATLGRGRIDALAGRSGLSTPVLTTREAFVLKGDAALRGRWIAMAPPARTALLARDQARFAVTPLDGGIFAGGPVATDTVEWFASPRATATILDRLRRAGEPTRAILAVNPGAPASAHRFAYLGYKGGSEPGVLTLNFLARTRSGQWFAVAAAWHRADGTVDEARLLAIASRALALLADR